MSMSMPRLLALVAALALVAQMLLAPATARAQVAAGGLATVAQGVATLQGGSLAWQLREVQVPRDPVTERTGPGFVYAANGPLVVRAGAGIAQALQAGQAAFVGEGERTMYGWPEETTAWELALVPADMAGGGGAILVGDAFRAPEGEAFDLELLAGTLRTNATAALPAGAAPTVIVAARGEVKVEQANAGTVTLGPRQAVTVPGNALLRGASGEEAAVIAVRVASTLPAPPPASGAIGGMQPAAPTAAKRTNCCEALRGVSLTNAASRCPARAPKDMQGAWPRGAHA